MTGDFRDGSSISFTPPARTSKGAGRALGVLLVAVAAALGGLGIWLEQTSSEVRNGGVHVPGVLIGYVDSAAGSFAQVSYDIPGRPSVSLSKDPVQVVSRNAIGRTFMVYYDPDSPGETFIEGIDQLDRPSALYLGAAGLGALGLIFTAIPPRARARR